MEWHGRVALLQTSTPKEWHPRVGGRINKRDHPGTAVLWDEEYFEVIEARQLSSGEFRYRLEPWDEQNTIRLFSAYDEESEKKRRDTFLSSKRREKNRVAVLLASPFTGMLPVALQTRIEHELGVSASLQTLISSAVLGAVGVASAATFVLSAVRLVQHGPPLWLLFFGALYTVESLFRFTQALSGRVFGSFPVAFPYNVYDAWRHRNDPYPQLSLEVGAETRRRDLFRVTEPMLSLLTPKEQERIAEQFEFDGVHWGRITAFVIVVVAFFGLMTSFASIRAGHFGGFVSAIVALWLCIEQGLRFAELAQGKKAGSILGALLRPLVKDLLVAPPASRAAENLPLLDGE